MGLWSWLTGAGANAPAVDDEAFAAKVRAWPEDMLESARTSFRADYSSERLKVIDAESSRRSRGPASTEPDPGWCPEDDLTPTGSEPAELIEHKVGCGLLVRSGPGRFVWVVFPFAGAPEKVSIAAPDRPIEAVIVLNADGEGHLPLTAYFAADDRLPLDQVYVMDPARPHDWHPAHAKPRALNQVLKPQPLPERLRKGDLTIERGGRNWIRVRTRVDGRRWTIHAGVDIALPAERDPRPPGDQVFVGSFEASDDEALHRTMSAVCLARDDARLDVLLLRDLPRPSSPALVQVLTDLGLDVHVVGPA